MIRAMTALLLLSGCALVDQTTFAPEPDPKPAPPPAVKAAGPTASGTSDARAPLLTIRYDVPAPDYGTVLPLAVHTAQQRRPGTGFDVVAVVASAADAAQGQTDAAEVSRQIVRLGTPATRVHLALRIDPATSPRAVLVYPR
jgi:hypothetical protein